MGSLFTAMERKIIEKSEKVCREALKSAAYELQQDVKNNICYKIVDDYYEEYTPIRYRRTNSLYRAWDISTSITGDRLHFYPDLDSDRLPQHKSNSQFHKSGDEWIDFYDRSDDDDNGVPDNSWILKNFFEGVHPRFFLDKKLGVVINDSEYHPGVLQKMGKYINEYKKSGNMINILAKHLKQACKTYNE